RLLVALQRGPRTLTIEANRFRSEDVLDGGGRPAGQPEGGDETKRNCVTVRQALVPRCSFECVRKRVTEVEDRATALIEGIAQAHCRLEGDARTDHRLVFELPEWTAREQAGLHNFRQTFTTLRLAQRGEHIRIGDHSSRI